MKQVSLFLGLLLCIPLTSSAQFGDLGKKMKKKIGEKAGKVINVGSMFGSGDVETEAAYEFDFSVSYQVETESSDAINEIQQLYHSEGQYMGMIMEPEDQSAEIETIHAIIDIERSLLLLLDPVQQSGVALAFEPFEEQMAKEEEEETTFFRLEKTDETKEIAGYLCIKYLYEASDGSGVVWATREIEYDGFDVISYLKRIKEQSPQANASGTQDLAQAGFLMELDGVDENGQAIHLLATEVNENATISYQMDQYQVNDMTGLQKLQNMDTYPGYTPPTPEANEDESPPSKRKKKKKDKQKP